MNVTMKEWTEKVRVAIERALPDAMEIRLDESIRDNGRIRLMIDIEYLDVRAWKTHGENA